MDGLQQLLDEKYRYPVKGTTEEQMKYDAMRGAFIAGYNARIPEENPEIAKAVENLPKWLKDAANVLNVHAERNGAQSTLSSKLNWYANKIEKATIKKK